MTLLFMSMEDDSRPVLVPTVATRSESTPIGWRGNRRVDDGGTPEYCFNYPFHSILMNPTVRHRFFGSAWHRLGQRDVMALWKAVSTWSGTVER